MGLMTKFGLGGSRGGSTQARFMKVLDKHDLNGVGGADTDTTMTSKANWYRMGKGFVVPAQQTVHFGYGSADLPDNQGYLYILIQIDDEGPVAMAGKVRLVQANAQETVKYVVAEYNLASTHGSVTNKAMQIALPEQNQYPLVGEDSLLWIEVKSDDDTVVLDMSASEIYVPVTIYQ